MSVPPVKKKQRMNRVKCRKCGKVVGSDPKIKTIAHCPSCHRQKASSKPVQTASSAFARTRKGPAEDLPEEYRHYHFRSGWERNFARILCKIGTAWTYEERVFSFHGYRHKPHQYIPDFYDVDSDEWWEIKGFLHPRGRQMIRRFKRNYPEEFEKLHVCCSKNNKATRAFFENIGVPKDQILFIEDLRETWKDKIPWE